MATTGPVSSRRRTAGTYVRDAIIAVAIVIVGLVVAGEDLGTKEFAFRSFTRLLMPRSVSLYQERMANKPAHQAQKDGEAADKANDHDAAIRHFTRAIELYGPANATAAQSFMTRAHAFEKMAKLQDAAADYGKVIALEPHYVAAYRYRAQILSKLGRDTEALDDYEAAIRQNPDSAGSHIGRGNVLNKLGRTEDALAAYAQALKAASNFYDDMLQRERNAEWREKLRAERDQIVAIAHVDRGNIYRGLGRFEDALAAYAEALRGRPDYTYVYVSRGWLHEKHGQIDLARADYEKAAALKKPDEWLTRALERTR